MSTRKYCNLHEPHDPHEWLHQVGLEYFNVDHHWCEGVLDVPSVWVAIRRRDAAVDALHIAERRLETVAHNYRRREGA